MADEARSERKQREYWCGKEGTIISMGDYLPLIACAMDGNGRVYT